jgi:hypothetical protein
MAIVLLLCTSSYKAKHKLLSNDYYRYSTHHLVVTDSEWSTL